tara:strand:+ start:195 stop:482 length:288 start_codon:yes stop_codon:yes gene_type:complete
MSSLIKKKQYMSEHKLFTYHPVDSADYEIWEDMKIAERLDKYIEWFKSHDVSAKKYNFKKYSQMCESPLSDDMTGHVTVQILDKKIDTLFRLTWL